MKRFLPLVGLLACAPSDTYMQKYPLPDGRELTVITRSDDSLRYEMLVRCVIAQDALKSRAFAADGNPRECPSSFPSVAALSGEQRYAAYQLGAQQGDTAKLQQLFFAR